MTLSVDLEGLDTLEASVAATVAALQDPELALSTAKLIAVEATPLVPRDTGKLAASQLVTLSGSGAELVYTAPYSVIVQARQPWLGRSITQAVPRIVELYADQAVQAWT